MANAQQLASPQSQPPAQPQSATHPSAASLTPPLSLFEALTCSKHTKDSHEALLIISNLLKVVGHEVCTAKHHTHLLYDLVSGARDVNDHIITLINQVDEDKSNSDKHWESFTEYTEAIEPLENFLFEFILSLGTPQGEYFAAVEDILKCIESVESWGNTRIKLKELATTLRNIGKGGGNIKPAHVGSGMRDDYIFLSSLDVAIKELQDANKKAPVWDQQLVAGIAAEVSKIVGSISNKNDLYEKNSDVTIKAVQFAMLIDGILKIASTTKDQSIRYHLTSSDVLGTASELGKLLNTNLAASPNSKEVEKKWKEFIEKLKSIVADLPAFYWNLRKIAAKIRRPYFLQAVTLIQECKELAEYFKDEKKEKTTTKTKTNTASFNKLEPVLKDVEGVLNAARIATTDPLRDGIVYADNKDIDAKFESTQKSIEGCFGHFDKAGQWSAWSKRMEDAKQRDDKQHRKLTERFDSDKEKITKSSQKGDTEVKITIQGSKEGEITLTVEKTTLLGGLQYMLAQQKPAQREKILSGKTCFTKDSQKLGFEKSVHDLLGQGTTLSLVAVLAS